MKSTVFIFLGILFAINVFFRVRLMKLLNEIKKHQLRIEIKDLIYNDRFEQLTTTTYPKHAELLSNYRQSMILGLVLVILVVLGLIIYLTLRPA